MSDWGNALSPYPWITHLTHQPWNTDASDSDTPAKVTNAPTQPKIVPKTKWEGEDEDEEDLAVSRIHLSVCPLWCLLKSDWDESSEEEEKSVPAAPVAPPKKKGTLKAKLAEKEAEKALRHAAKEDVEYDSDEVLDPREKARRDKERELNADLHNAAELFGAAALDGTTIRLYFITCPISPY